MEKKTGFLKESFNIKAVGTEGLDPRYAAIERLPVSDSIKLQIEAHGEALEAVRAALPALHNIVTQAAATLRAHPGGRVIGTGAGTPGRIWNTVIRSWTFPNSDFLMAGGRPAIFRSVEGAEDNAQKGEDEIRAKNAGPGDVVIGIAASGTTPYTIGTVRAAGAAGALTVGIANNRNAPLEAAAALGLCIDTGPEAVAGSTRMKAGTAQKVVLNLITEEIAAGPGTQAELEQRLNAHTDAVRDLRAQAATLAAINGDVVARLKRGNGRLICAGGDGPARIGIQDLVELTPTYRWKPERIAYLLEGGDGAMFEAAPKRESGQDAFDKMRALGVTADDVVILTAAGGRADFAAGALRAARNAGALTLVVADGQAAKALAGASHTLTLNAGGADDTAFGTALKVALNTLTTQAMIGLNRVYKGMMVDVQATNEKLEKRAARMVATLAGCTPREAEDALAKTNKWVKPAILVVHGATPAEADRLLEASDGDLHKALAAVKRAASPGGVTPEP
jgi:N-acetylmuramic acid 6-phosphate etherase